MKHEQELASARRAIADAIVSATSELDITETVVATIGALMDMMYYRDIDMPEGLVRFADTMTGVAKHMKKNDDA